MSATKPPNDIILYTYAFSPFGKRVAAYLALRGVGYGLCEQPFTMPRPDLALLPVQYRRIPILTIGSDVYLDTRLILRALEAHPGLTGAPLGASKPADKFVGQLIEKYIVEGPVFGMAAGLVPVKMAHEPTFFKDRQGMLGRNWSKEELEGGYAECLNYIRNMVSFFEETIMADGRSWVFGEEGPKLADINALFMLDFAAGLQLPEDYISAKLYPKVFAWFDRYRAAVDTAKSNAPDPTALDGEAAAAFVHSSGSASAHVSVDAKDPTGLKHGAEVEVYAADWGTEYRDRGRLVGLTPDEVTIAVKTKGKAEIRVHAPRTGFKIREI
ncbi:hypothetical protein HBI81_192100 [Parastagonospora nodorum]|nr:hypothetical protein HBI78_170080 [Parastagonospora nodorum]KAH5032633.1 hypothetical protein HBI75_110880 [Parastagonospora nodorum]KAH5251855.1 hypothetical protein HBI70_204540 [Parastagonospora nodorum]KAH5321772.1 hypothetical protein HBI50_104030 [Parastagonospora nodorum]KAH5373322.1 hypothetical protein HBI48_027310 [Parastagonospora nodorum]